MSVRLILVAHRHDLQTVDLMYPTNKIVIQHKYKMRRQIKK